MRSVFTDRSSAAQILARAVSRALLAGALSLLAACGGQEKPGEKKETVKKAEVEVVATIGDLEITRPMLRQFTIAIPSAPYKEIDPLTVPKDLLQPIVEDLALALETGKRVLGSDDAGLEKTEVDKARDEIDALLAGRLYMKEILGKIRPPTEDQIQAFYTNNTEEIKIPFKFSMQQIVVSTYREVTTTETTTLEGLAERISGDVNTIDRILINSNDRPARAPDWNTKDRTLTTKPLEPGENLLVPLSPEGKKAPYEKIRTLKARLDAGEDFASAAKAADFESGLPIADLPHTGRSLLPEYLEAARNTKVNEISEVFETKHGYHIMKILKKREERIPPLEEVREKILANRALNRTERSEKRKEYTNGLFRDTAELKIQYDLFRNPSLADDAVVATLGNKSYTRGQLEVEVLGEPGKDTTDETILTALMTHKVLILDLEAFQARRLGLDKDTEFLMDAAGRIYQPLRSKYEKAMFDREKTRKVDDADIKAYYEEHKEELKIAKQFNFHVLLIQDADESKSMEAIRNAVKDVKTLEDFKKVVREKSTNAALKQNEGFQKLPDSARIPEPMRTQLNSMPLNAMGRPIFVEVWNSALAIWLLHRTEERQATYEEAKGDVSRKILLDRLKAYPEKLKEEMLTEAKALMR